MKQAFTLPSTPMCRVVFSRGGTNYGRIIPTPADPDDVRLFLLSLNPPVAAKDFVRTEPVTPLAPLNRPHPAQHRLAKYATIATCLLALAFTIPQTIELPASAIEWQNVC